MVRRPPRARPFPYTTLFRSRDRSAADQHRGVEAAAVGDLDPREQMIGRAIGLKCLGERDQQAGQLRFGTGDEQEAVRREPIDRKSTRLNSSHGYISYAVFCLNGTPTSESSPLSLHDALPI